VKLLFARTTRFMFRNFARSLNFNSVQSPHLKQSLIWNSWKVSIFYKPLTKNTMFQEAKRVISIFLKPFHSIHEGRDSFSRVGVSRSPGGRGHARVLQELQTIRCIWIARGGRPPAQPNLVIRAPPNDLRDHFSVK